MEIASKTVMYDFVGSVQRKPYRAMLPEEYGAQLIKAGDLDELTRLVREAMGKHDVMPWDVNLRLRMSR